MKPCLWLFLTLLFAASVQTASAACASAEDGTPVCAYWTRADAVFTGKALKVENAPKNEGFPDGAKKIRFQIDQNYKGADNPTFTVIATADCGLNVKSGQTWIIYAANDIVLKSFSAFRGVKIEPKTVSEEAGALKNIFDGKTESAISGRITGAASDEPIEITVTGRGFILDRRTDANGAFNVAMPYGKYPDVTYKVELKFPYHAALKWNDDLLGTQLTQGIPTIFKYDVRLNDGDCHFSLFDVSKLTQ